MALSMWLSEQVGGHRAPVGANTKVTVTEQSENGIWTQVPTGPAQWRISIHIFRFNACSRIQQHLDGLRRAKGRSTVQWCLPFGSAIPHETARFRGWLGHAIGICAIAQEHPE